MNIIDINNPRELPGRMMGYVCFTPEQAAQGYFEHYGRKPEILYRYVNSQKVTTIFIEIEPMPELEEE